MGKIGLIRQTYGIEKPEELEVFEKYIVADSQKDAVCKLQEKWQGLIDLDRLPIGWLVRMEWTTTQAGLFGYVGLQRRYVAKLSVSSVIKIMGEIKKRRRENADG